MIRNLFYILAICMIFQSCSDDSRELLVPEEDELTLTLRLPGFTKASRAVDENALSSLTVLFIDADGKNIGEAELDIPAPADGKYHLKFPAPKETAKVGIAANYDRDFGTASPSATTLFLSDYDPNIKIVFYGEGTVEALKQTGASIDLVRACAKTSVSEEADNFHILGINMYGIPDCGTVAPGTCTPEYSEAGTAMTEGTPFYHYEAEAGKCYLVIHGEYNGKEGYYKASYIPKDKEDEVKIVRNHHYIFTISEVNDYGWATEEEAAKSEPDNRISVDLKDDVETIYDMITCRDYELGVCKDVTIGAEETSAEIILVTSYKGETPYTVTCDKEWVDIDNRLETGKESVSGGATQSETVRYTLSIPVNPNNKSEETREAVVTVRSGDLSRTVRIIQLGLDFKRSSDRRAEIKGLGAHNTNNGDYTPDQYYDYFEFLDEYLQGATEKEMRLDRANGLHFRVCNNVYVYRIPRKEGDRIEYSDSRYTVTQVSESGQEFWKVELSASATDYDAWSSSFTIISADGIEIGYDVFHRGMFHWLKGLNQVSGPDEFGRAARTGWFYYEQVTVTGNGGGTYYILDRNMAASDNHFYSPSSTTGNDRVDARGGYFKIANSRSDMALTEMLPPSGYEIPGSYHLEDLGIQIKSDNDATPYKTTTGNDELKEVYFPQSGYMEGEVHKNEVHACLWSRTLVSGNQGFSEDSPEYGYWFRYLDIYGQKITSANMRIGTRSSDPSGIGFYKAMPVRCIHTTVVPPTGWDLQSPAEGRRRLIVKGHAGPIKLYWWGGAHPGSWNTRPTMYKFGSSSTDWYYDIPDDATNFKLNEESDQTITQPGNSNIIYENGNITYEPIINHGDETPDDIP